MVSNTWLGWRGWRRDHSHRAQLGMEKTCVEVTSELHEVLPLMWGAVGS
jgi:hypothetical protein